MAVSTFWGGPFDGGKLDVGGDGVLFRAAEDWAGLGTLSGWWIYRQSGKDTAQYRASGFLKSLGTDGRYRSWATFELGVRVLPEPTLEKLQTVTAVRMVGRGGK